MKRGTLIIVLMGIVPLYFTWAISYAADDHHDERHNDRHESKSGSINLSQDLRNALIKEMVSIEKNMGVILGSIYSGEWERIVDSATRIEESFILRQELSNEQLEVLHKVLPKEFVALDVRFHSTSSRLAHAAKERNAELVNFYFYKMNEACVACHSAFARERFPDLEAKQEGHLRATHK